MDIAVLNRTMENAEALAAKFAARAETMDRFEGIDKPILVQCQAELFGENKDV